MKISILMPTYNDQDSILETLVSLNEQTYKNWELLIMDDGSNDNTVDVIEEFKNNNSDCVIKYYKQKNSDQLNAVRNLIPYITGDVVFILHSDDLFASGNTLQLYSDFIAKNPGYDSYYGDLIIIDEESKETGEKIKPPRIDVHEKTLALTYLLLGRNSYVDYSFFDKKFFVNELQERYLKWNQPYWFDINKDKISKSIYVPYAMAKYRIHSENYINNAIGNAVVLSGNLRVFTQLMSLYSIPLFHIQSIVQRILRKIPPNLMFIPFYFKKESHGKDKLVENVIVKRMGANWKENVYFESIFGFFKNIDNNRMVDFSKIIPTDVYLGSDATIFFRKLSAAEIDEKYYEIMEEISKGLSTIQVDSEQYDSAVKIIKFFCIEAFVEIVIKNDC